MKILLLGEYSNVHWTLAQGLRELGHNVTVVSDGDGWKQYPRDIDLRRKSLGRWDTLKYLIDIRLALPKLRGFDVVQIINPVFLELRGERIKPYYDRIRQQNGRMFLGSFGIDKPWVEEGLKPDTFRYSDFYLYGKRRYSTYISELEQDWIHGSKAQLFDYVAEDADGIIASLYENYRCCQTRYSDKLHFIPYPVVPKTDIPKTKATDERIRFFIGIQKERSEYKGTDKMLRALHRLQADYPDKVETIEVSNVPFARYRQLFGQSHVLLDQIYSYTPAMNALEAMSQGLVVVGGAEEEHYKLLGEKELRPIINVQPTEEDIYKQIEQRLLQHPDSLAQLSSDTLTYIKRHHHYINVARQYLQVWGL